MNANTDTQMVTVDHGDLLEACQAANAWAGQLRRDESARDFTKAADRIDAAVARLRRDAFDNVAPKGS